MTEQFIGNYKILKKIGAGGMAKVYLAVHKDVPNLRVVLKILSDSRLVERFKQEADKLALLDGHPNICQIKHFFNHGDDFVIAMEYIEGTTLEDFLKSRKRLAVGEASRIIGDVLDILDFAHQKGIFHRDIKPGNIMIDRKGQVKIIDFGIAKAENDPNLTLAGTSCGTPAYMAPEQFTPTDKVNYTLVDIYAVGVTLYYTLTGELPFKGNNEFAIRDAKIFSDPIKPRALNGDIPKEIETAILKALKKTPEDRFQTCDEMHQILIPYLSETPRATVNGDSPTETTPVTPRPKTGPPLKRKKRSGLIKGLSVAAAVVIVAVLVYFIFPLGEPEPLPPEVPVPAELTPPITISPTADTVLPPAPFVFRWSPIEGEDITYYLELATDTTFSEPIPYTYLTTSELMVDTSLPEKAYYWRVRAEDADGNRGDFSARSSFIVEKPQPVVTEGYLTVKVEPRGDVYLDDKLQKRNTASVRMTLKPGRHTVKVVNDKSNQIQLSREVKITNKADITERFQFTFPDIAPEPELVKVRIGIKVNGASVTGGTLYIDDGKHPLTTPNTYELTAGKHIIRGVITFDGETLDKIDTLEVVKGKTSLHFIEIVK